MKRLLQIASVLYIAFALLVAHFATPARGDITVIFPSIRIDIPVGSEVNRDAYTVEVWSAEWCVPCKRYKAVQVPVLKSLGYKVVFKDIDRHGPPDGVEKVPTIRLYHNGKFITQKIFWRALAIEQYVKNRAAEKADQPSND